MKGGKTRQLEAKAMEYGMTFTQHITRIQIMRSIMRKDRKKRWSRGGSKEVSKRIQRIRNLFGFLAVYYYARPDRDTLKRS